MRIIIKIEEQSLEIEAKDNGSGRVMVGDREMSNAELVNHVSDQIIRLLTRERLARKER